MAYGRVANGLAFCKSKLPFLDRKIVLRSDKTYIVPSGFGFSFSLLAMVLLVLAINSANNLIYFFAFFLISIALTGMLITNQNIESIKMTDIENTAIFANEKNLLPVKMKNKDRRRDSWDITMQITEGKNTPLIDTLIESLKANQEQKFLVAWVPTSRGKQMIPRLKMQSRFPFGMLKAWKYFQQDRPVIVFPQRKGQSEMPLQAGAVDQHEAQAKADTKGYFRDFRSFQKSDSPNRIDWKRSLKHQKHLVKNYEAEGDKKILIDWDLTPTHLSFEDRLSQLTLWVDLSHRRNELYGLKINALKTDFGSGVAHYRYCLEQLALQSAEERL